MSDRSHTAHTDASEEGYGRAASFHQLLFNLYSEYMMKDALEAEDLTVSGQNVNNLRYADDAVFLSDKRKG